MLQSVIQRPYNIVLADQCRHDLAVMLKPLKHIKPLLKCRLIVGLLRTTLASQLDQNSRELQSVIEN